MDRCRHLAVRLLDWGSIMNIAIYGAGQQGEVVLDCVTAAGHHVIGFVDDSREGSLHQVPVARTLADLPQHDGVIVAIGHNETRKRVTERLRGERVRLVSVVHPHAVVSPLAHLGDGVVVLAGAVVSVNATVGDGAIIDLQSTVGHDTQVGAFAHLVGTFVAARITIGEGAFLAIGSKVAPDVCIGAWASVLFSTTVSKHVPDGATAAGSPARILHMPSAVTEHAA